VAVGETQLNKSPVLVVRDLVKHFVLRRPLLGEKVLVHAVDGIDLTVAKGETLGIVGESGSGKTTVGRCILRLIEPTEGELHLLNQDILQLSGHALREMRRKMQMVFQDPADSLNPRFTCRRTITSALRHKGIQNRKKRLEKAVKLLESVGLGASDLDKFPHQFSGGQQQRIAIARALAFDPILLVLDEPTASLDVSVQTQITKLLRKLQEKFGHSHVLISHDLSTVRHVAQRVAVMYLGKLVEVGVTETVFAHPQHPYTQTLIKSVPIPAPALRRDHIALEGEIPSSTSPPSGCRFHTRCPNKKDICAHREPRLTLSPVGTQVACHLAGEIESN
jgi:oligopeptide/dipeptide ABC transporter ATP-binding protein